MDVPTLSRNAAVLVAAGRGSRMGNIGGPKQYELLAGKAILQHTAAAFLNHPDIHAVQIVIHGDDSQLYKDAISDHQKLLPCVFGGKTRQQSCKAGIDALDQDFDKVLIHDAARPFVSEKVISNVLSGTGTAVCALPATAISDTIKRSDAEGNVAETVSRDNLYAAQTPQGFMLSDIAAAHEKAEQSSLDFTDDAAVAEFAGLKVKLVEGERSNTKITTQEDLVSARKALEMNDGLADIRTGSGYDIHTLGPGNHVYLCGVKIDHDQSLQGHSDADVGLHSLTDALLGTIGAGDIGSHFPPSDPQWKGAASDQFLRHAFQEVKATGGVVTNLDVTIICEAPKVGPHRDTMREKIADICELELFRVSVKATTNEKIGTIGRGEGIAALATATVAFPGKKHV